MMNTKIKRGLIIIASLILVVISIAMAAGFIIVPQKYREINHTLEQLAPSPEVVNQLCFEGYPKEVIDSMWDEYNHYLQNVLTDEEVMGWLRYYEPELYLYLTLLSDDEKEANKVEQRVKTITITFDNQVITTTILEPT